MTLAIWVEARIRTPAIAGMIPIAAYGIVHSYGAIRTAIRIKELSIPRRAWLAAGIVIVMLIIGWYSETKLPLPTTASGLPSDATAINAVYDGKLKLLGWKIQNQYTPAGRLQPFRPYVVSLYWQLMIPPDANSIDYYSFSLGYFVGDKKLLSYDHPIGSVAYPHVTTADWQVGTVYVEHVGLTWKDMQSGPIPESGMLLLSVYPGRNQAKLFDAVTDRGKQKAIELDRPAILWDTGRLTTLTPQSTVIPFGDVLKLVASSFPKTATAGESIDVHLGWQTTDQLIWRSYAISVVLLDQSGKPVAQTDSPPMNGKLLTTSLPTNYLFEDVKILTLPKEAGTYSVLVTVYDSITMERLIVPNAPDNLLKIGEITVTQ
jgi:hypothetical protein